MSVSGPSVILSGVGASAPANIVTNDDLSKTLDTSDEWIRTRSGIAERRIAKAGENASDYGAEAARIAIERAGLTPDDIDLVITATMSPDQMFPATACYIQDKLGLRPVPAFDLSAACSGFLYALETGSSMLKCGNYRHVLIIGAEKMSSVLDWEDRGTCVLFGDGAGAAVLSKTDTPDTGVLGNLLGADGSRAGLLYMPAGGSAKPASADTLAAREHGLRMNGKEIFKIAVRYMAQTCRDLLEQKGLSTDDIACVVPHQANIRILEALAKNLGLPMDKFIINMDKYGNTSAASIPIALEQALQEKRIKSGDLVLMAAFGGGLTWAASVIKWH